MIHRARARASRFLLVSSAACAVGIVVGCTVDTPSAPTPDTSSPGTTVPAVDSGNGHDSTVPETPVDAATDAATGDACADGGCAAPTGCAAHPGVAFCDDFDDVDALKAGKTKWDFIEPTDQPVATLSAVQKVSAPSSLLSRIIDGTTPGAKFAKTVTKAGFVQTTWEYDVFLENIGTTDGFFLDDFQFTDAAGADSFGFRLVMFSKAGAIDFLRVEHNQQVTGGPYIIEPALPSTAVTLGMWHHFKQEVKWAFASGDAGTSDAGDAGDGGAGDRVDYSLWIDDAVMPAFQKKYAAPTRQQTAFARIAGMPLVFNKANSAGLKIYWDNHVLELK